MDMGTAVQTTYLRDLDIPGDKVQFGDLTIRFLVDEDLKNYMEIQKWIRGLGYPESEKTFVIFNYLDLVILVEILQMKD